MFAVAKNVISKLFLEIRKIKKKQLNKENDCCFILHLDESPVLLVVTGLPSLF